MGAGETTITREMNRRHLTVKVNLRGRDLASFLAEAQKSVAEHVHYRRGPIPRSNGAASLKINGGRRPGWP